MNKDWKFWLREVCAYYKITQKELIDSSRRSNLRPKSTYYWLLFKSGIDLERASMALGKERTTILKYIKNASNKEINKYRDKSAEDYLLNKHK